VPLTAAGNEHRAGSGGARRRKENAALGPRLPRIPPPLGYGEEAELSAGESLPALAPGERRLVF
jgi:hypothetical protein